MLRIITKFLAPIVEEILFLLSEQRRQKKDWSGKRDEAPEKYLKEKIYDMIPNRCRKKSYENAESNS